MSKTNGWKTDATERREGAKSITSWEQRQLKILVGRRISMAQALREANYVLAPLLRTPLRRIRFWIDRATRARIYGDSKQDEYVTALSSALSQTNTNSPRLITHDFIGNSSLFYAHRKSQPAHPSQWVKTLLLCLYTSLAFTSQPEKQSLRFLEKTIFWLYPPVPRTPLITPHKEADDCHPWTSIAKNKFQVEKEIQSIPDLNWIIVRPAIVYGKSDRTGLTPRLVFGAVYRHLGEMMKMMWDENLVINTVHVTDVARAIVWLCQQGKTKQVYNIVDDGNTKQGDVNNIVSDIFNINHDYWGNTLSTIAKTDAVGLVSEINEKHLVPWAAICSAGGLDNTPLTPYIDQNSVHPNHLHLDGSKLRKEGFTFSVPKPSHDNLMEILKDFIGMKMFPANALPSQ
ncbi:uncharacterized protein LOC134762282 [Penaeus indicus]|uniref:uncharacterized protein LOC134762282 n=1 Tax=Penaeus indicus TaxID=29960 RepID=UPI00300CEF6C